MAIYSRGMLVFALGILVVCLCCMKAAEANDEDSSSSEKPIHVISREHHHPEHHHHHHHHHPEDCETKNSHKGQECRQEDDDLGLDDDDIDDTFKVVKNAAAPVKSEEDSNGAADYKDSPNIANNNVVVLGH